VSPALVASLMAISSIVGAYVLLPFRDEDWLRRGLLYWALITPPLFFGVSLVVVGLTIAAVMTIVLAPRHSALLAPFYLLILFSAPPYVKATVPFPGLEQLLTLDYQQVVSLALFIPIAVINRREKRFGPERTASWVLVSIAVYCVIVSVLAMRETTVTNSLRSGVELGLSTWLLAYLLIKLGRTEGSTSKAFQALLAVAVVFSVMCIVIQIRSWNFYSFLDQSERIWKAGEYRFGILRTSVTVNTGLLGFVCGVGSIICLSNIVRMRSPRKVLLLFLMGLGCLVSLSRGAWLAAMLMVVLFYLLRSRRSNGTIAGYAIAACLLIAGVSWIWQGIAIESYDEFGTFSYRQEIYAASWQQFQAAPLLGAENYLASGRFDHLVQGEGIIDIVSVYLLIVLRNGIVGLAFYVLPFALVINGLLKVRKRATRQAGTEPLETSGILLAAIIGYMMFIGTTSDVSLVKEVGVILLALSASFIGAFPRRLPVNVSVRKPAG